MGTESYHFLVQSRWKGGLQSWTHCYYYTPKKHEFESRRGKETNLFRKSTKNIVVLIFRVIRNIICFFFSAMYHVHVYMYFFGIFHFTEVTFFHKSFITSTDFWISFIMVEITQMTFFQSRDIKGKYQQNSNKQYCNT